MVVEFRPLPCADDQPNPDVHGYLNGIFVRSLNLFFYYRATPGNYSRKQLKDDVTPIVYHLFRFGEAPRPVCHVRDDIDELLDEPVGEGGVDPILWRVLRIGRFLDDQDDKDEDDDDVDLGRLLDNLKDREDEEEEVEVEVELIA